MRSMRRGARPGVVLAVGLIAGLVAGFVAAPAVAVADDDEPAPDPTASATLAPASTTVAPAPAAARSTDHAGQFGFSGRVSIGLRGIATYDDTDYCGKRSPDTSTGFSPACIGRAPMSLDLEASYGFGRHRELLVEFRVGLERDFGRVPDTDGPRVHFVAPGVRFFFNEAKTSKLFTQVQLVVDFSSYKDPSGEDRGADYGFRNLNGLWFDLHHAYGFYVYIGETLTLQRWIMGSLEAGIGFQGRYP
jgi:hypothetical protein